MNTAVLNVIKKLDEVINRPILDIHYQTSRMNNTELFVRFINVDEKYFEEKKVEIMTCIFDISMCYGKISCKGDRNNEVFSVEVSFNN